MRFQTRDLMPGDIVTDAAGVSYEVKARDGFELLVTRLDDLLPIRVMYPVDWAQVHRDGKQIYPVSETAHTDDSREEANK